MCGWREKPDLIKFSVKQTLIHHAEKVSKSPYLPSCCDATKVSYAQQDLPSWIGGHGTVAYEQYTQQSPSSGFRTVLHAVHS